MKISTIVITFCALAVSTAIHLPSHARDIDTSLYIDNLHIIDINTGQVIKNRQLQLCNGKITAADSTAKCITV